MKGGYREAGGRPGGARASCTPLACSHILEPALPCRTSLMSLLGCSAVVTCTTLPPGVAAAAGGGVAMDLGRPNHHVCRR